MHCNSRKSRMIAKSCPKCDMQVAVASKTCKCGYSFYNARRGIRTITPEPVDERRRTSRVRREKPNYYDSQEYDNKKKKAKVEARTRQALYENQEDKSKKETTAARAKRRRQRKEDDDSGVDLAAKLPMEKQEIASIILAEINRKLFSVAFNPA